MRIILISLCVLLVFPFTLTANTNYWTSTSYRISIDNFRSHDTNEVVLTSTVYISTDEVVSYKNKIIRYESSESPVFSVAGKLELINCTVILGSPVDFIEGTTATIYLENVKIETAFEDSDATLFNLVNSNSTITNFTANGFKRIFIEEPVKAYFSGLNVVISKSFMVSGWSSNPSAYSFVLRDSNVTLNYQGNYSDVLDISIDNAMIFNNVIKVPLEALRAHGAWLTALKVTSSNIVIRNNTIINGGKAIACYGAKNVLIESNIFVEEELVEGSELQIAEGCEDIVLRDNTFRRFWEAIEIYSYDNITVQKNRIFDSQIGVKIEVKEQDATASIFVRNNTMVNSNFFIFSSKGPIIEKNYIENAKMYIQESQNVSVRSNTFRNGSIWVYNSRDIYIVDNVFYLYSNIKALDQDGTNENIVFENNTIFINGKIVNEATIPFGIYPYNFVDVVATTTVIVVIVVIVYILVRRRKRF